MHARDKKQTRRSERLAVQEWLRGTQFRAVLVLSIAIVGVLYIVQTSSVSTKGFEISGLQKQIRELERENRSLDVAIAEQRSMSNVQQRIAAKGYVSAGQLEYITPVGTAVARR